MERRCDSCSKPYDAKRKSSRFCGGTCRMRASRARAAVDRAAAVSPSTEPAAETTPAPAPTPDEPAAAGPGAGPVRLFSMVEQELAAADRIDTVLGQAALLAARRLEADQDTGSAVAGLIRELRATMSEAIKGARATKSAVEKRKDELAARRRGA